jgi:UDP-glucose 4-epimerase
LKIVVTGGVGFVGLPLCRKLHALGHDLLVVDNLKCGEGRARDLPDAVRLETLDIRRQLELQALFRSFAPAAVIHLAAIHFIPECNRNPVEAIDINVVGTDSVLQACAGSGPGLERVIVTSSAAVYPIADDYFSEASPLGPTDIYGQTKAINERQLARFAAAHDVRSVGVRLYNVYGPGETNPHVIPEIVDQIKRGSSVLSLGDTAPKRSYVFVDDVADAYVRLLAAALSEPCTIVNLGNSAEASVDEVVGTIATLLGTTLAISHDPARYRPSERPFLRCDPSRLTRLTGWQPTRTLLNGLKELLCYERLL